jgi:thiamine biosynthesis lipoprotein
MQRARPLLGTFVSVRAEGAPRQDAAIAAAFNAVEKVERLMSCHDPSSELSRLNESGHRRAVPVHPWTFEVFRLAVALFRHSAGSFDCAIGGRQAAAGRLPSRGGERSAADGSSDDIDLSAGDFVRYRRKLHIDFGGIAKGFAVDRAVDALRRAGATSGAVNAGGDMRSFGANAEPVHVRLPGNEGLAAIGEIRDAAVATSIAGEEPPLGLPILDGRSLCRPVASLVSVFAGTCALADALTKVVALQGTRSAATLAHFGAEALRWERDAARWSRIPSRAS